MSKARVMTVNDSAVRRIYPSLVLVQPRKTRPYIFERLLMGRKIKSIKQE